MSAPRNASPAPVVSREFEWTPGSLDRVPLLDTMHPSGPVLIITSFPSLERSLAYSDSSNPWARTLASDWLAHRMSHWSTAFSKTCGRLLTRLEDPGSNTTRDPFSLANRPDSRIASRWGELKREYPDR